MKNPFSFAAKAAAILVCSCAPYALALDNGLGLVPIMGWNPWSNYRDIGVMTLDTVRKTVDALESKGLKAAGYVYVNQDADGCNFSSLVTNLHSRGFKYGVYAWTGWTTSPQTLATRWANVGADYVKFDYYTWPRTDPKFTQMRDALAACGRDIIYNAHSMDESVDAYAVGVANSWRTGPDIYIPWETPNWDKIMYNTDRNTQYAQFAKPGYYNDPDFLLVGLCDRWAVNANGTYGFNDEEERTIFNLWCIMASPLILGSDPIGLNASSVEILTNAEVIALDQDPLGYQGRPVVKNADQTEIWVKNLKNGDRAVMPFNRSTAVKTITVRWSAIGLSGTVAVRDLWEHTDLGAITDSMTVANIPPHGSRMYRVSGQALGMRFGTMEQQRIHSQEPRLIMSPVSRASLHLGSLLQPAFDMQGKKNSRIQQTAFVRLVVTD